MSEPQRSAARTLGNHGWLGTGTLETRTGRFAFRNGYPDGDSAARLRDTLLFNRAIEVYLAQMPAMSWYRVWKAVAEAGRAAANQILIWESLMDAETLLLTGNTETVYGLASFDLKRDGPLVIQTPPALLGGFTDMWQHQVLDIGPTGADKGKGAKFLLLPPDYDGHVPAGYVVGRARTFRVSMGVRGFLSDGKPDRAVALMKTTRIYPIRAAARPPETVFVNASHRPVDTLFADTCASFEDLAHLIASEPETIVSAVERFQLAQIGIEKFRPFKPNAERRALLDEAARLASAIARANSFASADEERLVYSDRMWEWAFIGGSADWDSQGYVNSDRRAAFAYIAIGMSPAMVDKVVGFGSQYLWTPRDAAGDFLDGAESYRLHIPANIPVKNFWSVVIYDADSRSLLANGEPFPSVSAYTGPDVNVDGSIDISFGPELASGSENNWIRTVPGKGWFALFRFYGPLQPFFDKSWKPGDIERVP